MSWGNLLKVQNKLSTLLGKVLFRLEPDLNVQPFSECILFGVVVADAASEVLGLV